MKVAVVGAGGIGGYYGALLQRTGHNVTFLARGAHLAAMRDRGLRLESVGLPEPLQMRVRATDRPEEVGPVDLALFAVKSYDADTAAQLLTPLLGGEAVVLSLHNGVENMQGLSERMGRRHMTGGAAYSVAAIASPGGVTRTGG